MEVSDVGRKNVRRYLIELRAVRSLLERFRWYSIELRAVRSLLEELQVSDRVRNCKKNVRRNIRYLIELIAVGSLLEGFRGI